MNLKYILSLLAMVMLYSVSTIAQQTTLTLINENTNEPIIGASYKYQNQTGTSDKNGQISIDIIEGESIQFSHISFGKWQLNPEELKASVVSGKVVQPESIVNLYPVSVIGLHPNDKQTVNLQYQDKLSHDGGDVLAQIPAIGGIRKSGSYGFDPVLRGFKYEQLNVVLNGCQSAIAACPNRMDPPTSQMAPNMMDRVEILKGPHALRYGNAFGGTINYIAAAPEFSDKSKFFGRLSGGYESNGNMLRTETNLGWSNKLINFSLFGAWSEGENYKDGSKAEVMAGFQRYSYGANLGIKLSDKQTVSISSHRNIANDVDFPALPMDLRSDDTWVINANHQIKFSNKSIKKWETTAYATYVDHLMDNLLKQMDPRNVDATTNATTKTIGARTETQWLLSGMPFYLGADYKLENAQGSRVRNMLMGPMAGQVFTDDAWQNGSITKMGAFAEYHSVIGSFNTVFSVRLEINEASIVDKADEFTAVNSDSDVLQINPAFSFGGVKQLSEKMNVGFWIGRSQRSASLTERYINFFPVGNDPYEMLGNPNLKAEANNQVDLKYTYTTNKMMLSVDVFAAFLQNNISAVIDTNLTARMKTSPGVRQYQNIGDAFKTGFEFNWNQKYFSTIGHNLNIAYTYAESLELDEPLAEIPPMDIRYKVYGQFLNKKLQPEITARYVLDQNRVSEEFGELTTPAFGLIDVKVSYNINKSIRLAAGVKNLLNENYYEHLTRAIKGTTNPIYAPGRSLFASLNLRF